jgi:serine/threonine protein phosphatase PrpC
VCCLCVADVTPSPPQDCSPQSYYAVFDGHVAVDAADYASVHLLPNVVRHPDFHTDPASALRGGILTTDQRFCKINQKAGSTAVVALLRGSTLHVAWVGDSQAMLFRRGQGVELVNPHKPDREV